MSTLIVFLMGRLLVGDTGMYMFDLQSAQWAIYQKYDQRGEELPSVYGALGMAFYECVS